MSLQKFKGFDNFLDEKLELVRRRLGEEDDLSYYKCRKLKSTTKYKLAVLLAVIFLPFFPLFVKRGGRKIERLMVNGPFGKKLVYDLIFKASFPRIHHASVHAGGFPDLPCKPFRQAAFAGNYRLVPVI